MSNGKLVIVIQWWLENGMQGCSDLRIDHMRRLYNLQNETHTSTLHNYLLLVLNYTRVKAHARI